MAADQDGIVARAQLLKAGLSPSTIDRAIRAGRLHRVHHGVYSRSMRAHFCTLRLAEIWPS